MTFRVAQFMALLVTALALVPSAAHLAALPNKIALPQGEYFIVQRIYRGWALLGALWAAAIVLNAWLAYLARAQPWPAWLAVGAASCFALMLAVFFLWTFPANQATANWTSVSENWEMLRQHWEYSYAVNAGIALVALCLTNPPPIWLMRQAGRYLPEYRETRAKAGGFLDLCYSPALAAEVTLQPIRRYGFDAAILFAELAVLSWQQNNTT